MMWTVIVIIALIAVASFVLLFMLVRSITAQRKCSTAKGGSIASVDALFQVESQLRAQMDSWLTFLGLFAVLFGLLAPLAGYVLQHNSLAEERARLEKNIDERMASLKNAADHAVRKVEAKADAAYEKSVFAYGVLSNVEERLSAYSEKQRARDRSITGELSESALKGVDFSDELKKADSGDAKAQLRVGHMYHLGTGVEKDDEQAVRWYREAAAQGSATAKCDLGWMYEMGCGVKQDVRKAVELYKEVADTGNPRGLCDLAQMYLLGKGVEKDLAKAFYLRMKAAEQGYESAQSSVGMMYEYGMGIKRSLRQAVYWYGKAAEGGNVGAKFSLGSIFERGGDGVEKDIDHAKALYFEVIQQGQSFWTDSAREGLLRIWSAEKKSP